MSIRNSLLYAWFARIVKFYDCSRKSAFSVSKYQTETDLGVFSVRGTLTTRYSATNDPLMAY